jgi:hypothetical protein
MSVPADAVEQRKLRSLARRYERDGYRVTMPRQGGRLPAFLEGFTPDLIAESEQDRVVIEVKRSDALRGSNNLVKIAERVSREPGWRFELVTLAPVEQVSASRAEHMDFVESRVRQVMSDGLTDMAFVYVLGALEAYLEDLASQHGLKVKKAPFAQIVRDLVFRGVISRETFDKLEAARSVRNLWMHANAEKEPPPSAADVEDLLALARRLRGEMATTLAD